MGMRGWKAVVVAGVLGAVGGVTGCNERRGAEVETEEGRGGAGMEQEREGLDMGQRPGVLRDGEGPLERGETRPGEQPGVMNDGEGPLEERTGRGGAGDVGQDPGILKDGEGPLEREQTRPGEQPGMMNDGEGPLEERR